MVVVATAKCELEIWILKSFYSRAMTIVMVVIIVIGWNRNNHSLAVILVTAIIGCYRWVMIHFTVMLLHV